MKYFNIYILLVGVVASSYIPIYFWFFSPLMLSADSCSFLFSFFLLLLSAFFVFGLITYDWSVQTYLLLLLWVLLLLQVPTVCVGVCAGVHGCVRVCVGMQVCVWDDFSEYLLETRVNTSADFNTYPIRIFYFMIYPNMT